MEVLRNEEDGTERGSLLWLLDHTRTPAGGRLMRSWVAHPLTDGNAIARRLDAVEELSLAEADGSGDVLHGHGKQLLIITVYQSSPGFAWPLADTRSFDSRQLMYHRHARVQEARPEACRLCQRCCRGCRTWSAASRESCTGRHRLPNL